MKFYRPFKLCIYTAKKLHLIFFISIISFLLSTQNTYSQYYRVSFEHITVEDGLSGSCIKTITQDTNGFMWFGTTNGLNRFDGMNIKVYQNDPLDINSLVGNMVSVVKEDTDGDLLIGTVSSGFCILDPETDTFTHLPDNKADNKMLANANIHDILIDSKGHVWIATIEGHGLFQFDKKLLTMTKVKPTGVKLEKDLNIWSMVESVNGKIWFGDMFSGLLLFDPEKNTLERHDNKNAANSTKGNLSDIPMQLYLDNGNVLWIAAEAGLWSYSPNEKNLTSLNYIFDVDDDNRIVLHGVAKDWFKLG